MRSVRFIPHCREIHRGIIILKTLLTVDLTKKVALDGTSAWTPPVITYGEALTIALRFQQTIDGNVTTPVLDVTSLAAVAGFVDARPFNGEFCLQIGDGVQTSDNTTGFVQHDASAAQLQSAINAKTVVTGIYGPALVRKVDGSWLIIFGSGAAEVALTVRDNRLYPVCIGRITAAQTDARWIHELRLIQIPVAMTSDSSAILPDAPTITRLTTGGTVGTYEVNDVQNLYVSPAYNAQYTLALGSIRTSPLNVLDNAATIQAALEAVLGTGNFSVKNSAAWTASIEFTGIYAGTSPALLTVTPLNPPAGDLTFTIAFANVTLLAWLRSQATITVPLQVWINVLNEDASTSTLALFTSAITIQRPVLWPELETVMVLDLLRPASPKDYVPFSLTTFVVGHQFYRAVVGDGSATTFVIAHGLDTDDTVVFVRINADPGAQLVHGTDFSVTFDNANQCTVHALSGAPTTNHWAITVMSEQVVEAFADGLTVTIGQVTGLQDALDALQAQVSAIEALIPTGSLTAPSSSSTGVTITIPDAYTVFPNLRLGKNYDASVLFGATASVLNALPRAGGLLPAVHDTSAGTFSTIALPSSPSAGDVFQYTGTPDLFLPGGLGRRGTVLQTSGFVAWDGRVWYQVIQGPGASTSYFPAEFEEELVPPITFEPETWAPVQQFRLEFDLSVQLIHATGNAQWVLVIEHGRSPSDTDATTTAIDITTAGTGTQHLYKETELIGTFTANASTNVLTLTAHGLAAGDIVYVANTGGALPSPLTASTAYIVRDVTTDTFKLTTQTETVNLQNVIWNPTPILTQRLVVSRLLQTRHFGCIVARAADNTITTSKLVQSRWSAGDSAPTSPGWVCRVNLIRFDTEDSQPKATGYAFAALKGALATIS